MVSPLVQNPAPKGEEMCGLVPGPVGHISLGYMYLVSLALSRSREMMCREQ